MTNIFMEIQTARKLLQSIEQNIDIAEDAEIRRALACLSKELSMIGRSATLLTIDFEQTSRRLIELSLTYDCRNQAFSKSPSGDCTDD